MTFNSTVDFSKININNYVKYTDDPTYNYKERNIKYMPFGILSDQFVNNYNSMIVRNNNGYYDDLRSTLNYNITNDEILDVYRQELKDYVDIYKQYWIERKILDKELLKYDKFVNDFVVNKIVELNKIMENRLQRSNDVIIYDNSYMYTFAVTIIGILLGIFIIVLCIKWKNYYK